MGLLNRLSSIGRGIVSAAPKAGGILRGVAKGIDLAGKVAGAVDKVTGGAVREIPFAGRVIDALQSKTAGKVADLARKGAAALDRVPQVKLRDDPAPDGGTDQFGLAQ